MNVGGCWVFGRPDDVFIENDVLYRRIWETEQVIIHIPIITKEQFMLCYNTWVKGDKDNE